MAATGRGRNRTSAGIRFRVIGEGEPVLLLHGLMVTGAMFDPLVELLRGEFRMLVPDLRGHGAGGDLPGPYDVPGLAADMPAIIAEAGFERVAVLGYSHGGAVAQQLAHQRPDLVSRLMLACTYACNVATVRERIEASVLIAMLAVFAPASIGKLVFRASKTRTGGPVGLTADQARSLRDEMAANRSGPMRAAARGLVTFDSRPWLGEIRTPTVVIGGALDTAVPRHHFDTLLGGIPGAVGRLVEGAGHTLIWTHTRELAAIVRENR